MGYGIRWNIDILSYYGIIWAIDLVDGERNGIRGKSI